VTSETNPTFRLCREVLSGSGIRKHGLALLAGRRQVAEVLKWFPDRIEGWVTPWDGPGPTGPQVGLTWIRLTDALFKVLDVAGTHAPLVLVRVPEITPWDPHGPWPEGCTLFVPFQDPENVGAVIRSAAAFRVPRVVLLRESAHPFHPKASRAAGTALFQVPMFQGPSIHDLDPEEWALVALSTEGDEITTAPFPGRFGLVPGLEGPGLPDRLRACTRRRIPIAPGVESLNAAAAVAVALYEWRRREQGQEPTEQRSDR
jgi:16S rRNA (guanine527-N7)-methyltransferase